MFLRRTACRIHRCTIELTTASHNGGAVHIDGSDTSTFEDVVVSEASCPVNGGGFYITSSAKPVLRRVQIQRCAATSGGGMMVAANADPLFSDVTIRDCNAEYGGGLYAGYDSNSVFDNCSFLGNTAFTSRESADGGGAFFTDNAVGYFTGCVFRENYAQDDGGAVAAASNAHIDMEKSLLADNTATNSGGGAHFTATGDSNSTGSFVNCTFAHNTAVNSDGGGIYMEPGNQLLVDSSIVWGNTPDGIRNDANKPAVAFSNTQKKWFGPGNLITDPLFADPCDHDYHLKSQSGRWDSNAGTWVKDQLHSECIDRGYPGHDWTVELWPHGARINMGAYGGTPEASMSMSQLGHPADCNNDGVIDVADLKMIAENWLAEAAATAADINRDGIVDFIDLGNLSEVWKSGFKSE